MTDQTYNGWTNYQTWRVHLECFDGTNLTDLGFTETDPYQLGQDLKDWVVNDVVGEEANQFVTGWALAFIDEVNWMEIAEHLLEP